MQSVYEADPKKVIVCLVGLPARGKTYISKKLYRFLNWLGFKTEVFNVGMYRRKYLSQHNIELTTDFFDHDKKECLELREQIAASAITDLIAFINKPESKVVILDGTNSTRKRRETLAKRLQEEMKHEYQLLMVESICNDELVISENIKKVKVHGLDYALMDSDKAIKDFEERIKLYEKYYDTLTKEEGYSYVKTVNVGRSIEAHNVLGYLPEKIMSYVINLTISPDRIIYLSRHGESNYNTEQRIGGNPSLSNRGIKYSKALPKIFTQVLPENEKENMVILTSTLKRTNQTVEMLKELQITTIPIRILDELNAGICEEMTYQEIEKKFPEVYKDRKKDKLRFRYPSGESYLDVIGRLEPLIYWIERQKHPIAIFGHQAVLRCIEAYLYNIELEKLPYIDMPLHTITRLTPETYTFTEEQISVDIETGEVNSIEKVTKKKYSIDYDGSHRIFK